MSKKNSKKSEGGDLSPSANTRAIEPAQAKVVKGSPPVLISGGTPGDGTRPTEATLSPRALLLPYQRRWVDDESRFKFGLWSRQTGKDFSSGEEGVRDCYKHEVAGSKTTWLIGAAGERQALESLEKWKEWTNAYKLAIADVIEDRDGGSQALLKSATIVFPGGSRVIAVPANPDTVRGYSANILLTEFAFIEDMDATWRAIVPSITNPLRGGLKKIRIITTPNGVGNKAHDLWVKNALPVDGKGGDGNTGGTPVPLSRNEHDLKPKGPRWSCHKVTIEDAVREGLPVNIEELRAALDDPDGWAQEFLCEFMDTASVLLPYELLATCESLTATETVGADYWRTKTPWPIVIGIDFGRKKDLTCAWSNELINQHQLTKEVLCLEKVPTPEQEEILRPRIEKATRVCLDYTGPGIGLGDYLVKRFGEYNPEQDLFGKVQLCTFTNNLKCEIFPKLKRAFEAKTLSIPVSREIREDLHGISRVTMAGGGITYKAPHTADGHSDRCTALALANRAASFGGGPFQYSRVLPRSGPGGEPRARVDRKGGVLC